MDNDIFECIRCGAQVYHAASQCPHCGLDLYPEELEEEHVPDEPLPRLTLRRFSPAGALLIGGILSLVFTFGWLSLRLVIANVNSAGGQAILLLAGPLAALLAGYGDCALLRKLLPLHGLLLGVFTTFNAVVLSAIWRDAAFTRTLFHSLTPAILALCLLGSFAGQFIYIHLLHRANRSTQASGEDSLYVELLHRVGFDQARLERLLEEERRTAHGPTSRNDLLRRAIARWDRDNQ